jgi:hypothetical protein
VEDQVSIFKVFIILFIELSEGYPKLARLAKGLLRIYCCYSLCESFDSEIRIGLAIL